MSWAIWITGIPGSGKSGIARAAAAELSAQGRAVQILELDALRRALTPTPTYDETEREAVYRALVTIAHALTRADRPVIIDATAHRREWRELARASIGAFAEVQLVCPLEVARARERTRGPGHHPRSIYAHAGRPGATVPGVDVPYEPAVAPALIIDTTRESVEVAGLRVAALAHTLSRRSSRPSISDGWTIWVSGRPGSGKTTLVAAVCERLRVRGMPPTVLEAPEFAATIVPEGHRSHTQRELITRAIALAAKLLAEAGRTVIIDGAFPLRGGAELAREIIDRFAHVELVCPPDVCRARECAVRWKTVRCPDAERAMPMPDLGLGYEMAVIPDLALYTDVLDERTAAEEVVRLVERRARAARDARRSCA